MVAGIPLDKASVKSFLDTNGPQCKFDDGYYLIYRILAVYGVDFEVAKMVIDHPDTDLECKSNEGWCPIHMITFHYNNSKLEILKYLLKHGGFNINAANVGKGGVTPLHFICEKDDDADTKFEAIKCLVENGADVNAIDINWDTPLHYAARNKKRDLDVIFKYFMDHGADIHIQNKEKTTPSEIFQYKLGEFDKWYSDDYTIDRDFQQVFLERMFKVMLM